MVKTCVELRDDLRKVGRKVSGTKAELKERLESVLQTNDRGWVRRGSAECERIRYLDSGAHRHVYLQRYTKGPRKGQCSVEKVFKTGSVYENTFFQDDIQVTKEAEKIITSFNKLFSGARIYLNEPEVWQSVSPDHTGKHSKCLVEPYLEGTYHKFNSNTGFADGFARMQALSHYSFEVSNGSMVLCDLQGIRKDDIYILTDPVICSSNQRFGATDLGPKGIENFFAHHKCGQYCSPGWRRPAQARVHFQPVRGTTFGFAGVASGRFANLGA